MCSFTIKFQTGQMGHILDKTLKKVRQTTHPTKLQNYQIVESSYFLNILSTLLIPCFKL